jgi:DNA-binding NtrC family response regulator
MKKKSLSSTMNLLREFFRKLLEKTVAQIHTAESGVEGIQALQQSSYSLVILDIRLPDANGIDILKQIREKSPLMPVIMITAYGTVEDAVRAMRLGPSIFDEAFEESDKVLITIKNAIYQGQLEKKPLPEATDQNRGLIPTNHRPKRRYKSFRVRQKGL